MAQFTKDQLGTEIASILILQAYQSYLCSGREAAAWEFLGIVSKETYEPINEVDPARIDLNRFPIAASIFGCYDYAFHPTGDDRFDPSESSTVADFLSGMPREDFNGMLSAFPNVSNTSLCADALAAADARASIDGWGWEAGDLSIRQVALLADMTEGAVRNALAQKGDAALKAIPKSKPVRIEVDEARRWLAGRRGFRPTPKGPSDDPILNERLRGFERMAQLADFIERHAVRTHGSPDALADALGWSADELARWTDGTFAFDPDRSTALGTAIGADGPTFVGKALELSLRRDATGDDGAPDVAANEIARKGIAA